MRIYYPCLRWNTGASHISEAPKKYEQWKFENKYLLKHNKSGIFPMWKCRRKTKWKLSFFPHKLKLEAQLLLSKLLYIGAVNPQPE